jgi:hypothetical protein
MIVLMMLNKNIYIYIQGVNNSLTKEFQRIKLFSKNYSLTKE